MRDIAHVLAGSPLGAYDVLAAQSGAVCVRNQFRVRQVREAQIRAFKAGGIDG